MNYQAFFNIIRELRTEFPCKGWKPASCARAQRKVNAVLCKKRETEYRSLSPCLSCNHCIRSLDMIIEEKYMIMKKTNEDNYCRQFYSELACL